MFTSPVPIYLGCAGLIVGSLGLGAQHLMSRGSAPVPTSAQEQPLFAKSVEEAALPATHWPSANPEVAFYEPMVELLNDARADIGTVAADCHQARGTNRCCVARGRARCSSRAGRNSPRGAKNHQSQQVASNEQSDQTIRSAAGSARKSRTTLKRGTPNRAVSAPLSGWGGMLEPVEMRSRSERGGQRVVIREETREPERFARERQRKPQIHSIPAVRHLRPALSDPIGRAFRIPSAKSATRRRGRRVFHLLVGRLRDLREPVAVVGAADHIADLALDPVHRRDVAAG